MFRLLSLTIVASIFFYGIESDTSENYIQGKIHFSGANKINENVRVTIQLRDTSLMDVPSKLIAQTVISNVKAFPIIYKLKYNPSDIQSHNMYSMSARIEKSDGRLLYINDVHTRPDFTKFTTPTVDINVIEVRGNTGNDKRSAGKNTECGPVKCPGKALVCPYGYQKKDGCEICRCNDPCNEPGKRILCGSKQRCFIDKKPDGTFEARCRKAVLRKSTRLNDISEDICVQPKVSGNCLAYFPRFFYNSLTKTCESFIYGGCGGNRNNFENLKDCEIACKS